MTIDERNAEVTAALTCRLEQMNSAIDDAENDLCEMGVFEECWITYSSWNPDPFESGVEEHAHLGIAKIQGKWRYCHAYSHDAHPEFDLEWKPVRDASVRERIAALEHLDKVRHAIVETKERLIPLIEKTISQVVRSTNRKDLRRD